MQLILEVNKTINEKEISLSIFVIIFRLDHSQSAAQLRKIILGGEQTLLDVIIFQLLVNINYCAIQITFWRRQVSF